MEPNSNDKKQDPLPLWDCGSALYDSFELNSFKRQLDSAINSRTMSMPRLPGPVPIGVPPPPPHKKPSKISRSFQRLLKSVFKSKPTTTFRIRETAGHEYFLVYDKSAALTTIPEAPEADFGGVSPEINSLASRTESERFSATSIGIYCA